MLGRIESCPCYVYAACTSQWHQNSWWPGTTIVVHVVFQVVVVVIVVVVVVFVFIGSSMPSCSWEGVQGSTSSSSVVIIVVDWRSCCWCCCLVVLCCILCVCKLPWQWHWLHQQHQQQQQVVEEEKQRRNDNKEIWLVKRLKCNCLVGFTLQKGRKSSTDEAWKPSVYVSLCVLLWCLCKLNWIAGHRYCSSITWAAAICACEIPNLISHCYLLSLFVKREGGGGGVQNRISSLQF